MAAATANCSAMDARTRALLEQLAALPVVDAHEHLHTEERRVARRVDIFLLFYQYLAAQYIAAGMPPEQCQKLEREDVALDEKWAILSPFLDFVRDNAVARPPFEALKHYFGEEDLTAGNYERLTEQMRAHNQPGLFERCLREDCHIVAVLNQNRTMWQTDLFKPILFENRFIGGPGREGFQAVMAEAADPDRWALCEDALAAVGAHRGAPDGGGRTASVPDGGGRTASAPLPGTLNGFIEAMGALLERRREEGMVGVKSIGFAHTRVERTQALAAYQYMRAGHATGEDLAALLSYLRDQMWEACGRLGLVAVVHTGVWAGNYADHTTIRPTNVLPMALAHRDTRFDLFHAGTPWPADAGMVARASHNIWLNLCWSHLISPVQYAQALDLWLDYVPSNRISGFGGDYWWNVENVYGALRQAQEALAGMLARRIQQGSCNEARALQLAQRWLHDNPRELYGLDKELP